MPRARSASQPRGGRGKFVRSVDTAERDAEAARLRSRNYTYSQIAEMLGFSNKGDAHHAVRRALKETVQEAGDEVRAFELERIDAAEQRLNRLEEKVRQVLERRHVTVNNGRVIYLGDEPIEDDTITLQATDRLLKIEDSRQRLSKARRELTGADAPVKVEAQVTQVTQQDIALQELVAEMKAKNATTEEQLRASRETSGD